MTFSETRLDDCAFNMWLVGEGEDNKADVDKLKRLLPIVIEECCTEKQQTYMMHYFVDRMTMLQIADLYNVNKSTVSRTICRGVDTAYSRLKFVSPLFIKLPKNKGYITNWRKDRKP